MRIFRTRRRYADFRDEVEAHLQLEADHLRAEGIDDPAAQRRAERSFGNTTRVLERHYESGRWLLWDHLRRDVRHGFRQLRRTPGSTVASVLTLALGIGANTLIFSLTNAAVLHPLAFRDADRLVTLWAVSPTVHFSGPGPLSDPEYKQWREANRSFSGIGAFRDQPMNLTGVGEPARLDGAAISPNLLEVLGVTPVLGRTFTAREEDAGHNRVALLGDELWHSRFNADPRVVGRVIVLDGQVYTVVGVMPAGFTFPSETGVWVPLTLSNNAGRASLRIAARLRPGVTLEQARSEVAVLGKRRAPQPGDWVWHTTLIPLAQAAASDLRTPLFVLFGAVGLVLLIACANVANLFLVRASARRREFSVRKALGASRFSVARQVLAESGMVALLGAGLGLALAAEGQTLVAPAVALLPRNIISPSEVARIASAGLDWKVLGFTLAACVLTVLLFGLAPALLASGADLNATLKTSGSGAEPGRVRTALHQGIAVAEVALAVMLLVGAGLLLRSFLALMNVEPGFITRNVLVLDLSLPPSRYASAHTMIAFERQALERLRALPGVESAGSVLGLPLAGVGVAGDFTVEGHPAPTRGAAPFIAEKSPVAGEYFRALGIPLLGGRYFDSRDGEAAPRVVIVSQGLARHFWPRGEAIGKRLKPGFSNDAWCTVVGVVGDVKNQSLGETSLPAMYFPYAQAPSSFLMSDITLALRAASDPAGLIAPARRAIESVDPDLPVFRVSTMGRVVSLSVARQRFDAALIGIFAALALMLAAIGVYGVLSHLALRRAHEIGVRMALGAQRGDVLFQIAWQGGRLVLIGIIFGTAGAWLATRFLSSLLFGVGPTDPITFALAPCLLAAVALVACILPARRAAAVNPIVVLRYE